MILVCGERKHAGEQPGRRGHDATDGDDRERVADDVEDADPTRTAKLRTRDGVESLDGRAVVHQAVPTQFHLQEVLDDATEDHRPEEDEAELGRLHRDVDQLAGPDHRATDDDRRANRQQHSSQASGGCLPGGAAGIVAGHVCSSSEAGSGRREPRHVIRAGRQTPTVGCTTGQITRLLLEEKRVKTPSGGLTLREQETENDLFDRSGYRENILTHLRLAESSPRRLRPTPAHRGPTNLTTRHLRS